jgi:hypothetical protein
VSRIVRRLSLAVVPVALLAWLALSGAASGSSTVGLLDCAGKPVVQPRSIVLACGDANFQAAGLRWTGWGESFAAAQGTARVNDCTPNCAAGHFHAYPVILVAKSPRTCSGRRAYSAVTYAFPAAAPPGMRVSSVAAATVTYRCG